jgi:uncharacterized membrane protein YcgQ (UPF0703/DUF1980 family)
MKKAMLLLCMLVTLAFACRSGESAAIPAEQPKNGGVIEIKEKMFIAQTNEIYINAEDYLGKTIKYEGFFESDEWEGRTSRYVVRNGPGCCPGVDNTAGFEVTWDNPYPEQNDWVEVVGTLEVYEEDGEKYLQIALTSLNVLDVRGADYVTQ